MTSDPEGLRVPAPQGPSLKARALRLLSLREQSRAELERKLRPHAESPEALQAVLEWLAAKDLQSEARTVEWVVHQRAAKLGTTRVRDEMRQRGLAPEDMAEALETLRQTEYERARQVWQQKFGSVADSPQAHARQVRFLASRGFAPEVIRRVVQDRDDD